MRDSTHADFIERWAHHVRENPLTWKKEHTIFIDAQFAHQTEVIARLLEQPNGKDKIRRLYGQSSIKERVS